MTARGPGTRKAPKISRLGPQAGNARTKMLAKLPAHLAAAARRETIAQLADLDEPDQRRLLAKLEPLERRALIRAWYAWAHGGQIEPPGAWAVWMMVAGRGFGKTRAGAEWISARARENGQLRIALVGGSIGEVRRVMIEGDSGLMNVQACDEPARWAPSLGRLTFASGAQAFAYGGGHPDALRGPQHHIAWCDELAKWGQVEAAWRNLRLGLRLAERPQALVTTTPRPIPLLRKLMTDASTTTTGGSTRDNPHLPRAFVDEMTDELGGTRLGRQELDGELIEDVEGSLWLRATMERQRVQADEVGELGRVVIGVDPPAGSGAGADACGIVAVGMGTPDPETGLPRAYVLEDASVAGARPDAWAAAVAACYRRWDASRVIAEKNQGGEMVEAVLRAVEAALPLTLVHAAKGKSARAEPVAALYEKGRVFHAGAFSRLEDEMAGMTANGGYEGPGGSPDRADALVWALTELMLGKQATRPGVRKI